MLLVDAFGSRWRLDLSGLEPALAAHLEQLWQRASRPADAPTDDPGHGSSTDVEPFVVARRPDGRLRIDIETTDLPDAEVPYAVSRAMTHASIMRRSGTCLMLHAAGVAAPDGSTVALVAPSGTGKTTAGRLLGRSLGYVSDETVAVEDGLRVRAYAKPLSVVVDPARPTVKSEHSPDELGLLHAPDELRLVATVVLERTTEVVEPVLEPMALVDAAALVLPQTSALPRLARPLHSLAEALTAGHGPWRLRYREIGDCADLVADLAAGHSPGGVPEPVRWSWLDGADHPLHDPDDDGYEEDDPGDLGTVGTSTVVRRARFDDALVSDGAVLVMHHLVPRALPGLAATLWLAAEHPVAVADLLTQVTAELGHHGDAETIVIDAVRSLVGIGLLRRVPDDA